MSRVTTYAADQVVISIAGRSIDSGYAEGEFVSIEMQSDTFSDKAGADGEVARSKNLDRRATIKIKLLHTSSGNGVLSALHDLALSSPNGADVGAFQMTDLSSGAVIAQADKAWIMKLPSVSRGKEITEVEWPLRAAVLNLTPVGNPSI